MTGLGWFILGFLCGGFIGVACMAALAFARSEGEE